MEGASLPASSGVATAEIGGLRVPIVGGSFTSAINEPDRAWFTIEMPPGLRLEYLAPVKVDIDGHSMIEGSIIEAFPQGTRVEVHVQSVVAMTEERMHGLVAQEFRPQDIAYAMARRVGFDDDHIDIDGLDDMPLEVFEFVVGIDGVTVSVPTRIGRVTFVPPGVGRRILDHFDPLPEWADEFASAPAHAAVYTTEQHMHNAQVDALAEVDLALSWLATRTRYGLSHLPDGTLHRYERSQSNATPSRRDLLALRSILSGRRWIQRLGPRLRATPLGMGARSRLGDPSLPRGISFQMRQALLSAERALSAEDPIQRSQALWESMEFFLAGRERAELFDDAQRTELLACLRAAVPKDQHQRVADLLSMVNAPPPRQALRAAIDEEAIPVTDPEFALLFRIRKARNRATHGAKVEIPSSEDLDYACSILSRILVHRLNSLEG